MPMCPEESAHTRGFTGATSRRASESCAAWTPRDWRFPDWVLWLAVHLWYLIGFQNRLTVAIGRAVSFVTRGRGARLITEAPGEDGYPTGTRTLEHDNSRNEVFMSISDVNNGLHRPDVEVGAAGNVDLRFSRRWNMEFLVEFNMTVPPGIPDAEVRDKEQAEAAAAAELVRRGHLVRLWKPSAAPGEVRIVGLYRADSEEQLDGSLGDLPLNSWMEITVTPLQRHPNDPVRMWTLPPGLPSPQIIAVYRLEAQLGDPVELGETAAGHRRIVPLSGGEFIGPQISGSLIPGTSADWQTVLVDVRYVLQTDSGANLYVESHGIRHGSAEVLARISRGEDVDASEYTFRTSTQITTASGELDWLNKGVFVSVAGRQPGGVIYETYLLA